MLPLYPAIKPYATNRLQVDNSHELYWEESGKIDRIPVLVIPDEPGSSSHPDLRRFFDPSQYRIVLFDPRGTGQSTASDARSHNTTQDLIADIEQLRVKLGVEQWVLFGASWGAALALLYAEAHPDKVQYLFLYNVFLGRDSEIDWLFKTGAPHIFPVAWREFIELIPRGKRDDLITAYHTLINEENDLKSMSAAKAWHAWHHACSSFKPTKELHPQTYTARLTAAQIALHYLTHHFFIEPDHILSHLFLIRKIPGVIIHGTCNMIRPVSTAFELNELWPASKLKMIHGSGHNMTEPALIDAMIRATNEYAKDGHTHAR